MHTQSDAPLFEVTSVCHRGFHSYCGRSDCKCACHTEGSPDATVAD